MAGLLMGEYGGAYVHSDIAFEFISGILADFKKYVIKDYKRIKSDENPDLKRNIRDYVSLNELLVLANMESYNAILIEQGVGQKERMMALRKLARTQLLSLERLNDKGLVQLEEKV